MIPTYNPSTGYLQEAIESVVAQQIAPEQMQIVLVDDGSQNFDPATFVQNLNLADRVATVRSVDNQGIGSNWNRCIKLAQGDFVHILHQDDRVLPGFYAAAEAAFARDQGLGAAFCRCARIDAQNNLLGYIGPDAPRGILNSWVEDVFVELKIAAPAMVVRRHVYQALQGFDTRFRFVLDWDMWKRLAVQFSIWHEPNPLIEHRLHSESTTRHLQADATNLREIRMSIEQSRRQFADRVPPSTHARARAAYARFGVSSALKLIFHDRDLKAAWYQFRESLQLGSIWRVAVLVCAETVHGLHNQIRRKWRR